VDDPDALIMIIVAPLAEHHGSEAQLADRDASAPEALVIHGKLLCFERWPPRRCDQRGTQPPVLGAVGGIDLRNLRSVTATPARVPAYLEGSDVL
jgi:hypothetical protein